MSIVLESANKISLNGIWEAGLDRDYDHKVKVPGLVTDSDKPSLSAVAYRREVKLPTGDWSHATLVLRGAVFAPKVFINGDCVSEKPGGMAQTFHPLSHSDVNPGNTVTLEVVLKSMNDIPHDDPSYISDADHWRCNLSSWIWDDVELLMHGEYSIVRVVPFTNFDEKSVTVKWLLGKHGNSDISADRATVEILELDGKVLFYEERLSPGMEGGLTIEYGDVCHPWSPESPNLYRLRFSVYTGGKLSASEEISWAPKSFKILREPDFARFELNGRPVTLRGAGIVWRRWTRDKDAHEVMHDTEWFRKHLFEELKRRGGNFIRMHLYSPPERLLDLCDELGIIVEMEWHFFHEYEIDTKRMREEWENWYVMLNRHPSVMFVMPYNETWDDVVVPTMEVAGSMEDTFPLMPLVNRDVLDIHRYWWGLSQSLSLCFDTPDLEHDKALFVGEFGGNYLDGENNLGGYPTLQRMAIRFLGRDHTMEDRIWWQAAANGKVGEYWRRIDAPGISAFCILGSYADGCNWYNGRCSEGKLKETWDWMTPVWSVKSVSLDLWNRNFLPGEKIKLPFHFFNETPEEATLECEIIVGYGNGVVLSSEIIFHECAAYSHEKMNCEISLPDRIGKYEIRVRLNNPPEGVSLPVVSRWEIFTSRPEVPQKLEGKIIGVDLRDTELVGLLSGFSLKTVDMFSDEADLLLCGAGMWHDIQNDGEAVLRKLEKMVSDGKGIVVLDAGTGYTGNAYPEKEAENIRLGYCQAEGLPFLFSSWIKFSDMPEPENHVHPTGEGTFLWHGIDRKQTWLWNGLRGGIVTSASDFQLSRISRRAFLARWENLGADREVIESGGTYYAYELAGYYAFSKKDDDAEIVDELRRKIDFLIADMPALSGALRGAVMNKTDLRAEYNEISEVDCSLSVLAECGSDLTRKPVVRLDYAQAKVIISGLLTKGRLGENSASQEPYRIGYDPAAVQMVLNMLTEVC